jgi:Putative heavy-metal-binding
VCELDVFTDAWNLARRRALDRLSEEALQVGADAIVGVRLHRSDHDLGKHTIEYVVTRTAVRLPGSDGTSWPVLTDVSVQDYWRLRSAGHEPVGLLATTVAVFASPARATRLGRAAAGPEPGARGTEPGIPPPRARQCAPGCWVRSPMHTAAGPWGVEFSHEVQRDKFALASSLTGTAQRGWRMGRLGIPYRVSGGSDIERRGWVITMHAAGTAIRHSAGTPAPPIKPQIHI